LNPEPTSFIVASLGESMKQKNENLATYKRLVDELLKETSDEKLVKDLMPKLGLKYTTEKIDRLTLVLAYNPRPGILDDLSRSKDDL
jgi:hypothetical protein